MPGLDDFPAAAWLEAVTPAEADGIEEGAHQRAAASIEARIRRRGRGAYEEARLQAYLCATESRRWPGAHEPTRELFDFLAAWAAWSDADREAFRSLYAFRVPPDGEQ